MGLLANINSGTNKNKHTNTDDEFAFWETPKGIKELESKVLFWDYDATLVYAASIQEVLSWTDYSIVDSKRKDRTNEGLEFLYWNHSLSFLQTKIRDMGVPCDVGAAYTSIDKKGHFHFSIPCDNYPVDFCSNKTMTIDWGDGTTQTISSAADTVHIYSKGEYECIVQINTNGFLGWTNTLTGKAMKGTVVFPYYATTYSSSYTSFSCYAENIILPRVSSIQQNYLFYAYNAKIFIPTIQDSVNWMPTDWTNCRFMCIPIWASWGANAGGGMNMYRINRYSNSSVGSTNRNVYRIIGGVRTFHIWCYGESLHNYWGAGGTLQLRNLKSLRFPHKTGTYIETGARFSGCINLENIISFNDNIGNDMVALPANTFSQCIKLSQPLKFSKITTIATAAFSNCVSLHEIDFSDQSVIPTLANINAFINCNANILIPDALFDEWVASTNWSNLYATNPDRFIRV